MVHRLVEIAPGNKSLEYLEKRIADNNYRGARSSQHNRYDMQQIHSILLSFYQCVDTGLMLIRTVDISKRPFNLPEESIYARFCDMAKRQVGIGSQDAMRKNLFVDLHRMGLIDRYDKHRRPADPYAKVSIQYVRLTQLGLRFIHPDTGLLGRQFIFTKAIDRLLKGFINVLLNIFREYPDIKTITLYELMFFVSGVRLDSDDSSSFSIESTAEAVSLIQSFNSLSLVQKRSVISYCEDVLVPSNFRGNKTNQRDFHNWKNKIQQMFKLLEQTAYFRAEGSKRNPKLCPRTSTDSINQQIIFNRSAKAKQEYFKLHDVCKAGGFELHHVVPLSWAESPNHFLLLDDYKNMVYIDGYNHARITQNRSRNVYMTSRDNDLILSDHNENNVELQFEHNVRYDVSHQFAMLDYNKQLTEQLK